MKIKKHIPNILSTIRLIMALALPFVFLGTSPLTTSIFYAIGNVTDLLDGILARVWEVQSKYGKVVDPIADKLLNGIGFILTASFINPMMFILVLFESLIAGLSITRAIVFKNKMGLKSDNKGFKKMTEEFKLTADASAKNLNVAIIGKIKAVAIFGATFCTMLSLVYAWANVASQFLFFTTFAAQLATLGKYVNQYNQEAEQLPESNAKKVECLTVEGNEDIKKLEYAKEKLINLSIKSNVINRESIYNRGEYEDTLDNEKELGITRTKKK